MRIVNNKGRGKAAMSGVQARLQMYTRQLIGSAGGLLGSLILYWVGNAVAMGFFTNLGIVGAVACFVMTAVFGVRWYRAREERDLMNEGIEGETSALHVLASLPDTYTAVTNPRITFGHRENELDLVLVGPNGVFVIETRNYRGRLEGRDTERYLTLVRTTRGGDRMEREIDNPIKGVASHVYQLNGYLKETGEEYCVQGMVYLSNPQAENAIESHRTDIPVFSASADGAEELRSYILNYDGQLRRPLSLEIVERIAHML